MKTLERGPRKRKKKLYRIKQLVSIYDLPSYIWRIGIEVELRNSLYLAGFQINEVPKEKWILALKA